MTHDKHLKRELAQQGTDGMLAMIAMFLLTYDFGFVQAVLVWAAINGGWRLVLAWMWRDRNARHRSLTRKQAEGQWQQALADAFDDQHRDYFKPVDLRKEEDK